MIVAASRLFAIEDLRISVEGTNVVLNWPSTNGETYVVQFRPSLDVSTPWTTLTNNMPPASGTNRTKYVVVGAVPPSPQSSTQSATTDSTSPAGSPDTGWLASIARRHIDYPPLPPVPWDPSTWVQQTGAQSDGGNGGVTASPLDSPDGGGGPVCGFYRVVRSGLHIIGLAQNSVIAGTVSMQFELGIDPPIDSLTGLYVSGDQDASVNGLDVADSTSGFLQATWNTTCLSNGSYTLVPGVQLGAYTEYDGTPVTVTISNLIRFPNLWPVAGEAMRIEAQTIHTNGTWQMEILDDQNNHLATLSGEVDSSGYCNLSGFTGPGFSLSLLDNNGNQLPYPFYVANVTTFAAAGQTPPQASGRITNFVEQSWWGQQTWFNVAYQQIYGASSQDGLNLQQMIVDVYLAAKSRYPNFAQAVQLGNETEPWRLRGPSEWAQLSIALTNDFGTRNLYYFGHGSAERMGYVDDTSQQINIPDLNKLLKNASDPLKGTNGRPYRFVFLDGCKTANGNLSPAFGIPKGNVPIAEFTGKRGIRPRAFVGWSKNVTIGWATFNQQHSTFIASFFDKWANGRDLHGFPLGIEAAIDAANPQGWGPKTGLVIHGFHDLLWMDDQLQPP